MSSYAQGLMSQESFYTGLLELYFCPQNHLQDSASRLLTLISDTVIWGLAFDHMIPGASLDSDYSRELKVSSQEGPLETYSRL